MKTDLNHDRLSIDTTPVKVRLTSDIYVVFTKRGVYAAAVDLQDLKTKIQHSLYVGAGSIAKRLESLRMENEGKIEGLELWIERVGTGKFDGYTVDLA